MKKIKESKTANPFLNAGFEHPLAQNDERFEVFKIIDSLLHQREKKGNEFNRKRNTGNPREI